MSNYDRNFTYLIVMEVFNLSNYAVFYKFRSMSVPIFSEVNLKHLAVVIINMILILGKQTINI